MASEPRIPKRESGRDEVSDNTGDGVLKSGTSEYVKQHKEVRRVRGLPLVCVLCNGPAAEWANISGEYRGVEDYQAMCVSCHRTMDRRRVHNLREDHLWETADGERCKTCRARSEAAEYVRVMADPDRAARRREQNRAAVARYKESKR